MSAVSENSAQINSHDRKLTIALAGNPNAGKTTLFNALTGLRQKVANYPGVTVESKTGFWDLNSEYLTARLIDLPGLYSLAAASLDEEIARDILLGNSGAEAPPDVIVVAVDATNLTRNLYLALQLIEANKRVVIALTMFDLAERTFSINLSELSRILGVPVIPVVSRDKRGLEELARAVLSQYHQHRQPLLRVVTKRNEDPTPISRYKRIDEIVAAAVRPLEESHHLRLSERIDRVLTHRLFGPLILLLVLVLVFQAIFSWATLPMDLIDGLFVRLADGVRANLAAGLFRDLLTDGVIAGVGGVLIFLPQILLLFLFISILEDSGYMARAAFLTDRLMRTFGLHGKAFMPLLSSFACAVPGVMATRTIENPKDRLATILIAPFMSCSARLPIYSLIIATFFSRQKVFGVLSMGVVIILGMYLLGVTVAIAIAWLLKHTILNAPPPPFVLELPPYRLPNLASVGHTLLNRSGLFLKRAGTVILSISILLWALSAFPRTPGVSASTQIENSYAGKIGRWIEPTIRPLGFDWRIGIGLISSFAARETIISTLSIVYNAGSDSADTESLVGALQSARHINGSPVWTPLVGLSLMIFFLLACQCISTLAIVRRETNSWRWPLFMLGYMFVLAYVGSLLTYQCGRLLGFT